jgi:exodeoxyribonuclease VII small subunit
MKKKTLSYTEAFNQLKEISSELQQGNISIELLPQKIKLARELILYCQNSLRKVEDELRTDFLNEKTLKDSEE